MFCIKSRGWKIASTKMLLYFQYSSKLSENKSEILKYATCASCHAMQILIPHVWLGIYSILFPNNKTRNNDAWRFEADPWWTENVDILVFLTSSSFARFSFSSFSKFFIDFCSALFFIFWSQLSFLVFVVRIAENLWKIKWKNQYN